MNLRLILGPVLILVLILAVAGCTQPDTGQSVPSSMTPFLTPMLTQTPESVPTDSVTPGPTGVLPDYWGVTVQAQSNGRAINPQIIITFRGGKGMNLIQRIELQITRSDGVVETGEMDQPLGIGNTVTFNATTGYQDRAEAWAITPQGDAIKILDQYVPFRSYNS